jgi:hypothetical protein
MPLVRLVADLRGLDLAEVAPRIENSGGIVLRDATPEEAEAISHELNRQDVPFVLIPTKELPEVKEIVPLFRVRMGTTGIRLRLQDGRPVDVKWKDILTVTCVRLERQSDGETLTPARLVVSIFTREPFTCYQLSENIPIGMPRSDEATFEPKLRFERVGRAIYETFPHAAQNKGMRILSKYGLGGRWKGLTFDRVEQVHSYNYWLALLRGHQVEMRGATKPRYSIPWLRRIEFEPEARTVSAPTRYRVRAAPVPAPVPSRPPVVISPREWLPDVTWSTGAQVSHRSPWLGFATAVAAICLALYIILELLG